MGRAASILAVCVLLQVSAQVASAAPVSARAHATIVEANIVRMNWTTALPSVQGGLSGASFTGNMPSIALGMMTPGNARLTVRRQDETGKPVTAPTVFEVISSEGDDALIVRTGSTALIRIARDGAIVGGALQGGSAASIEVGRGATPATEGDPGVPAMSKTLVVVVQYN